MYRARVGRAKKIEGLGQLSQKGNCRARIKINLSELILHAPFLHLTHPPRVTCYCKSRGHSSSHTLHNHLLSLNIYYKLNYNYYILKLKVYINR
jgi:hypothetical protein